ncbi:S8 family serine peptidase [Chenggangzhangella methanolivorans]|uniref:S8 family serine peptidase n=1 Tax=Chenggangzhangella methanolivorans TaxID=1437009 RepID=A0A9E6R8T1_9HYPH|nr:S8 family serine peptidase [Chenggangzhangella methanolivorans]QZN99414.1 S8 family serine peptidase [Chenggangzhangella methanolivorans]
MVSALAIALAVAPLPALAQSRGDKGYDRVARPGKHRGGGGGGVGAGIAGAIIGIGAGLLIEHARAKAAEREEIVEEEVERPRRRPERPKTEKPRPERPKVVRATPEDLGPSPKRKVEPKKPEPKVARQTPPKDRAPRSADRNRPPAPPSGAAPLVPAGSAAALAANGATRAPDEVLCEIRVGTPDPEIVAIGRRQGLERLSIERFALTGTTVVRYRIRNGRPVDAAISGLEREPAVASAQPNHIYQLSQQANSALISTQYSVAMMRLEDAHREATGEGVGIAVIDSAIDPNHPALRGAVVETFDPIGGQARPHSHGTAVAALAAGRGALMSPAPRAGIYAVRAFAPEQAAKSGAQGTTMHILRGLDWAAGRGVKVVNMSFAGPRDAKISEFIAAGAAKGAIYVAAAGNAGPSSPPLYPAADPNVIAVTAVDARNDLLPVANRGPHLSVAAPGVDVLVAAPGGGYGYLSGTSMASAEVAGLVALMVEAKPGLAAWQARAALVGSARDLGAPGPDAEFGAGLADARGALDALGEPGADAVAEAPAASGQTAAAAELAERP